MMFLDPVVIEREDYLRPNDARISPAVSEEYRKYAESAVVPLNNIGNRIGIMERVGQICGAVKKCYGKRDILILPVLDGARRFFEESMPYLEGMPYRHEFVNAKSYGSGTCSSGRPEITMDFRPGRRMNDTVVCVWEDIVDTGITMNGMLGRISEWNPESIAVVSLLSKPSRREKEIPDEVNGIKVMGFFGFEIPDDFVFGFGLDYNEYESSRMIPHILALKKELYL